RRWIPEPLFRRQPQIEPTDWSSWLSLVSCVLSRPFDRPSERCFPRRAERTDRLSPISYRHGLPRGSTSGLPPGGPFCGPGRRFTMPACPLEIVMAIRTGRGATGGRRAKRAGAGKRPGGRLGKRELAVGDSAVQARTGKTWEEWFAILDRAGGVKMSHK